MNPNGRVPVLQVGERMLPESNAACWWLATGSSLIPQDRFDQADMLRWMFFEQYSHEPNVATLRFWLAFVGREVLTQAQRDAISSKQAAGQAALDLMDDHLAGRGYLVGDALTLSDIPLYAYTHVAHEGGFDLTRKLAVKAWLRQIESTPGFVWLGD